MKGFLPRDVDLSRRLEDTFGWVEFEEAICEIIKWLFRKWTFELCIGRHWTYPHKTGGVKYTGTNPFLEKIYWKLNRFLKGK